MKLTRTPPRDTLQGVCTLLQNVCPELTPERLTSALREFSPNGNGHTAADRGQFRVWLPREPMANGAEGSQG